jgi:hypothetical protein
MTDRKGQVALVHSTGFWPRIVSWVTGSYWNHMLTGTDDVWCASAESAGVRIRHVSDFPGAVWSEFPETELARDKVAAFALLQEGKPYAFLDDGFIGLAIILRRNAPAWLRRRLRSGKRWECAELADVALQHGGVNVFHDDRAFGAVYPGSFEKVFRRYGWLPAEGDQPARWAPSPRKGAY